MHPTVKNIKTFTYLIKNSIFPLPANYKITGLYHQLEVYDYSKSEAYIKNEALENITLLRIDNELLPQNLYKKNSCTELFRTLFTNSVGVIFFGGPDIPPTCYGEPTSLLTQITDPYRHFLELSFLFHLLGGLQDSTFPPLLEERPDYPILGICLGMQSINVATGGTLYQDIPGEIYHISNVDAVLMLDPNMQHRNYYENYWPDEEISWDSFHQLDITSDSFIVPKIKGHNPFVWSSHHQCVKKLGKELIPTAWSMDGKIIESIAHKKYPNVNGVQFHPEALVIYDLTQKLKIKPDQPVGPSYLDQYGGEKGYNFHLDFWKEFALRFNQ